jgi:hypothetical protein
MCRRSKICTELGEDASRWSTMSPLWPKDWFPQATQSFGAAYRAAEEGDLEQALDWLAETRGPELLDW